MHCPFPDQTTVPGLGCSGFLTTGFLTAGLICTGVLAAGVLINRRRSPLLGTIAACFTSPFLNAGSLGSWLHDSPSLWCPCLRRTSLCLPPAVCGLTVTAVARLPRPAPATRMPSRRKLATQFPYDRARAAEAAPIGMQRKERTRPSAPAWRHARSCPLFSALNERALLIALIGRSFRRVKQRTRPSIREQIIWLMHMLQRNLRGEFIGRGG